MSEEPRTQELETAVQVATGDAVGVSLATRAQAEIQSAILIAKAHPRDQTRSFGELMSACHRPTFAKKARYSFPRGGKQVEGASINLAREAARCWGNIRYGLTVIPSDDPEWIQVEAWAHDAENNVWAYAQDRFRNLIQRSSWVDGVKETREIKPPTERDHRELVNRRGSLAQRNCLLQILPFDLIEDAEQECTTTGQRQAEGDLTKDRKETVRKLVMAFDDSFAVSQDMLERHLGHPVLDVDAGELTDLRQVFRSMRDGNTVRADHFNMATVSAGAADELQAEVDKATKPKKKPAAKKKSEPDTLDGSDPLTLYEFWSMCNSTDFNDLDAVADLRAMAKGLGLKAKILFDGFNNADSENPERPEDD